MIGKFQNALVEELSKEINNLQMYEGYSFAQAEELACDKFLTDINKISEPLHDFVQYILWEAGLEVGSMDRNPYCAPKKAEAQKAFESMMGVSDLSQLLKVRV